VVCEVAPWHFGGVPTQRGHQMFGAAVKKLKQHLQHNAATDEEVVVSLRQQCGLWLVGGSAAAARDVHQQGTRVGVLHKVHTRVAPSSTSRLAYRM